MDITFDPATTRSVSVSVDLMTGRASIDVVPVAAKPASQVPPPAPAPAPAPLPGLFSAQSPWNSSPVKPVLGVNTMPAAKQKPWIEEQAYSTRLFPATAADKPMTIYGPKGVADLDIANQLETGTVTIPRFPANVMPATGSDGHCEIPDPVSGWLHSFFQLRKVADQWRAAKYARTDLQGSGWGTVSNPDNARAAGCSTAGGLLLASELGLDIVPHALAIGMDKNGFVSGPVSPATLEDYNGWSTYTGAKGQQFPMGSLLMLPATFDVGRIVQPELKAIARTLMMYGGYVVDATEGSMNIYAEIGSGWNRSMVDGKYPASFPADMEAIKAALRQVVSVAGWQDRDGKAFTPTPARSMNLLSMRGPWRPYPGSKMFGRYDAQTDLYHAETTTEALAVYQSIWMHDEKKADRYFAWKKQCWNLNPEPGVKYVVRAIGEGAITAKMQVKKNDYKATYVGTDKLAPGQSATITWPTDPDTVTEVYIDKAKGAAANIRLELVKA